MRFYETKATCLVRMGHASVHVCQASLYQRSLMAVMLILARRHIGYLYVHAAQLTGGLGLRMIRDRSAIRTHSERCGCRTAHARMAHDITFDRKSRPTIMANDKTYWPNTSELSEVRELARGWRRSSSEVFMKRSQKHLLDILRSYRLPVLVY
jgi:hypothetical protein